MGKRKFSGSAVFGQCLRGIGLFPVYPLRWRVIGGFVQLFSLLFLPLLLFTHPSLADFHSSGRIPVGGVGGWDYLTCDELGHRVFLAHGDRVSVIDLLQEKVVKEIPGMSGVHGIALAPDAGLGVASSGKENAAIVFSLKDYSVQRKIATGENPDEIRYFEKSHEIYAFNGRSKDVTVFDPASGKVNATIALKGKPEASAADPARNRIFVNLEDRNSIAVIDTANHRVVAEWPLGKCESPTGLAFDLEGQRLFSACDNGLLVMMDAETGRLAAMAPIGKGPDGAAFDGKTKNIFTANGVDGTVTVLAEDGPAKVKVVQTLKTEPGARTICLNAATHKIYLPTADFAEKKAGEKRPKPVDGSQRVLVFGP
jgi:DNA-binding beta-propeller fold protein YncE